MHQVQQAVARLKGLAVVNQLQPGVEVAVMAQPAFDVLRAELDLLENLRVRLEPDQACHPARCVLPFFSFLSLPCLKDGLDKFALRDGCGR